MKKFSVVLCFVLVMFLFSTSVNASSAEIVDTYEVYHIHKGSSSSNGGCYTIPKTRTATKTCTDYCLTSPSYANTTCPTCGMATYYAKSDYSKYCPTTGSQYGSLGSYTHYVGCGHAVSSGTSNYSYSHQVSYQETYYDLGCGKEETSVEGIIKLEKTVDGSNYTLRVYSVDSVTVTEVYWNGSASSSDTFNVTGNGIYTCQVNYLCQDVGGSVSFSYVVDDYDTTPPVVSDVSYDMSRSKAISLIVNASDNFGVSEYMLD